MNTPQHQVQPPVRHSRSLTASIALGAAAGGVVWLAYQLLINKSGAGFAMLTAKALTHSTPLSNQSVPLAAGVISGGVGSHIITKRHYRKLQALQNKIAEKKVADLEQQLLVSHQANQKSELVQLKPKLKSDLQTIKGIGPKFAKVLQDAGINSKQDLAQRTVQELQGIFDQASLSISSNLHRLDDWIAQAKQVDIR